LAFVGRKGDQIHLASERSPAFARNLVGGCHQERLGRCRGIRYRKSPVGRVGESRAHG
jgi:hypothetical protein